MRWFFLSLILALPAAAEELRFEVGMRGLSAAQIVLQGDVSDRAYAVSGRAVGTGLVGAIVDIDYAADARGRVVGGRLRSDSVNLRDQMGDEQGVTSMRWSGGAPRVTASPGFPREPYDIDATDQRGSVDPLTAMFDLLRSQPREGLCNWRVAMFDGRRASQLSVGAPQAVDGGVRCNAEYRRVAGFEPEEMAERTRYPFSVTYAPGPDGMMRAVEMRAISKYGDAVLRRR